MIWALCIICVVGVVAAIYFTEKAEAEEEARAQKEEEAMRDVAVKKKKKSLAGMAMSSRKLRRVRKD